MDLPALLLFAGALIVAAGSPGPSIAALVARVLSHGARDVLPFLAAMWVGEAIWLACAVWGLAALAESFQAGFALLKWAGVAYLAWLAWRMWTAPVAVSADTLPARGSSWRMFAAGMAITLGNPKIMVFYLALLPALLDMQALGVAAWASLTATMLAVLISVDLIWVAAASGARLLLRSPAAMRIANRASAGVMAGAAAAIATR